ncbi:MAG: acyltransferase [Oscillospiraceae bacterium]|nr:acyltransferase [Oscillospiraceae bacterium]
MLKNSVSESKTQYAAIDACKWAASVCVVAIHAQPLINCQSHTVRQIYAAMVGLAVPVFFVVSGFFLRNDPERAKAQLIKTARLYGIWTLIYLPLTIYGAIRSGNSPLYEAARGVRRLFLIGEQHYSWFSWFLLASIYALLAIWLLLRKKTPVTVVCLILFSIYFASYLMNQLSLKAFLILFGDNRVFSGMAYMAAGMLLRQYEAKIRRWTAVAVLPIFLLGSVFTPLEYLQIWFRLPMAFALVAALVKTSLPPSPLWQSMRKASTVTYFTHMYVLVLSSLLIYAVDLRPGALMFFIALAGSTLLSLLVIYAERKNRLSWLKHLV